jgi:hypothetical protein
MAEREFERGGTKLLPGANPGAKCLFLSLCARRGHLSHLLLPKTLSLLENEKGTMGEFTSQEVDPKNTQKKSEKTVEKAKRRLSRDLLRGEGKDLTDLKQTYSLL